MIVNANNCPYLNVYAKVEVDVIENANNCPYVNVYVKVAVDLKQWCMRPNEEKYWRRWRQKNTGRQNGGDAKACVE